MAEGNFFPGPTSDYFYNGIYASKPDPSTLADGITAWFTDKPDSNGGSFVVRSTATPGTKIWDRVGGGYVSINTWANVQTYASANYSGCRLRVTDVGVNGSDWGVNSSGELFPIAPISIYTSTASFARAPSGTISTGSSGNITFGTAASRAYTEGFFVYLPSIATTPAITAGYYWCVMSSTTVGTLYSTTWSGSTPTIGAAINFTVGASYTAVTTAVDTPGVTMIGGVMGNYRRLSVTGELSATLNANAKTTALRWSGTDYGHNTMPSLAANSFTSNIRNKGASIQVISSNLGGGGGPGAAICYASVNTAADTTFTLRLTNGSTATDWWCIDSYQVVLFPR